MPNFNGASRRIADLSFGGRTKHLRHVHFLQAEKERGRAGARRIYSASLRRDVDVNARKVTTDVK